MNNGSPPTDLNARTGELTPPGICFFADLKSCLLFSVFNCIYFYLFIRILIVETLLPTGGQAGGASAMKQIRNNSFETAYKKST